MPRLSSQHITTLLIIIGLMTMMFATTTCRAIDNNKHKDRVSDFDLENSDAPPFYQHPWNGDDDHKASIRTRISYQSDSQMTNSSIEIEWCKTTTTTRRQRGASQSHTADEEEDVHGTTATAAFLRLVKAEAKAISRLLKMSVVELVGNNIDPPSKDLPNAQRFFQTVPMTTTMVVVNHDSPYFTTKDNYKNETCVYVDIPVTEGAGVCSGFLARIVELSLPSSKYSHVDDRRDAAARFLLEKLRAAPLFRTTRRAESDARDAESSRSRNSATAITLRMNEAPSPATKAREWAVRNFDTLLRDDLDRAAAEAWYRHSRLLFVADSDGRRGSYKVSLGIGTHDDDENDDDGEHPRKARRDPTTTTTTAARRSASLQAYSQIEAQSEFRYLLTTVVRCSPAWLLSTYTGSGETANAVVRVRFLLRLPLHLAVYDELAEGGNKKPRVVFWWKKTKGVVQRNDGVSEQRHEVVAEAVRVVEVSTGYDDDVAISEVESRSELKMRSWKAFWVTASASSSALLLEDAVSSDSGQLYAAAQVPLRIPRLPVEAYPPDLNKLSTLPAAIVSMSVEKSDDDDTGEPPVLEALRCAGASMTARCPLSSPSSSGRGTASNTLQFVKAANRVSVYQPGPDRAVPFVVLAFTLLGVSVLLIRSVAQVVSDE